MTTTTLTTPRREPPRATTAPPERPILDRTCWHCGRPFETRNLAQGLCPACERLADEDTRVTRIDEPPWNTCPECDCHGSIVIYHSMLRSWETGEYLDTDEVPCPSCDGLGFLTTPADPDPDMQEAHEKARRFTITRH